ncbi:MAG: NlpC/P60 family protein [Eubacteriales bacterium]|nr:NlpC/P60 family protein [Eubacteriales bacterium]
MSKKNNSRLQIRNMLRFVVQHKKKCAAAGCMLLLGGGSIAVSQLYVPAQTEEETGPVFAALPPEPAETAAAETAQAEPETEAVWQPTPVELNLAHYFPEGADTNDITQSLAGKAFKELMTRDEEWISNIYDYADVTPAQMAGRLGRPVSSVTGKYNPKDERHDKNNPSTWTVNTFKNIRMTVTDGDGHAITPYSNVPDIMSLANLYTYFKGVDDYDLFLSYANELWESSHSYTVSISDLYYCSGCMSDADEKREMEELEREAQEEEAALMSGEEQETGAAAPEGASEENTAPQESVSRVITAKIKTESEPETTAAETAPAETVPESFSPVLAQTAETPFSEEAAAAFGPGVTEAAAPSPEASEASGESTAGADNAAESSGAESSASQESFDAESSAPAAESEQASPSNGTETPKPETRLSDCPGHVDLIIHMKIIGLDEEKNLFTIDETGSSQEALDAEDEWPGWNRYTIASAVQLSNQDWFEKYGLTVSAISTGNPLTPEEINAYMAELPADLSNTRRELIRFALNSVGKVPYYWGGKPSAPDYTSNSFGVFTTADYKGRVLKGLDCSGWINWVYWSVTGRRLPYESTSGLATLGKKIKRNELQPGDIIVRTGTEAHVIMFLGWTPDGKIQCIHESSGPVNNVCVAVRDANWPYYRRLAD